MNNETTPTSSKSETNDQRISTWEITQSSRQLDQSHHQSIRKSTSTQPSTKFSKPRRKSYICCELTFRLSKLCIAFTNLNLHFLYVIIVSILPIVYFYIFPIHFRNYPLLTFEIFRNLLKKKFNSKS